jgi:hypothetical protein
MAQKRRRPTYEFKPDKARFSFVKLLHLTRLQKRQILQWSLYGLLCLFLLIVQDVIMSSVHIYGATTDLVSAAILLICVISDAHAGSLFVIIASTLFVFSGSAPGPYSIGYLTVLGVAAALFRQSFWRRGFRSNMLCAGLALLLYELAVWGTGRICALQDVQATEMKRRFRLVLGDGSRLPVQHGLLPKLDARLLEFLCRLFRKE